MPILQKTVYLALLLCSNMILRQLHSRTFSTSAFAVALKHRSLPSAQFRSACLYHANRMLSCSAAGSKGKTRHERVVLAVQEASQHAWPTANYEFPGRVQHIVQHLQSYGFVARDKKHLKAADSCITLTTQGVDTAKALLEIAQVHTAEYIADLEQRSRALQPGETVALADEDTPKEETYVTHATYDAAVNAVALALAVTDAVMAASSQHDQENGTQENMRNNGIHSTHRAPSAMGFVVVRPPGHHSTAAQASGFCYFANVAIVARYLQRRHGLQKVAIVDFDVHHGNGTQDIFYNDPSVLFVDLHQAGVWPGSGQLAEIGHGDGEGFTINVPLPEGSSDASVRSVFSSIVAPALRRFQPEAIVVSAGFDAHTCDPLGKLDYQSATYHYLGQQLSQLAQELCGGRLVALLEGGYDCNALGESVSEFLAGGLGRPCKAAWRRLEGHSEREELRLLEEVALEVRRRHEML